MGRGQGQQTSSASTRGVGRVGAAVSLDARLADTLRAALDTAYSALPDRIVGEYADRFDSALKLAAGPSALSADETRDLRELISVGVEFAESDTTRRLLAGGLELLDPAR
jgi:hypothetical protein